MASVVGGGDFPWFRSSVVPPLFAQPSSFWCVRNEAWRRRPPARSPLSSPSFLLSVPPKSYHQIVHSSEPPLCSSPAAKYPPLCSSPAATTPLSPLSPSDDVDSGGMLAASMKFKRRFFGLVFWLGMVAGLLVTETLIAGGLDLSPDLVLVEYCCIFSVFLSVRVGSDWFICMLYFSTGVGSGLLLSFSTDVGHVEIPTYWVRSSRFNGHCSNLGSHPPLAQSSVLPWPYQRFCEACGCECHLSRHSSETVGAHHLTSFDLSIKIGRLLVARSCVIIWRFLDPLRSFGSRPGL